MTRHAIAILGHTIDDVEGTVIVLNDIAGLEFSAARDRWIVTTAAGATEYDMVVLSEGVVAVNVPRFDPRVAPPTHVSAADWRNAYRGMLVDGVPNLVLISDDPVVRRPQVRALATWLQWMYAEGATRITSRPPVTEQWKRKGRRINGSPSRDSIDLSNDYLRDEGVVEAHAVWRSGDFEATAPVRLAGHMEPLDGNYHWYGIIDDIDVGAALKKLPRGTVTVSVNGREPVPATVSDKTVWGTYRVAGIGSPPFPL